MKIVTPTGEEQQLSIYAGVVGTAIARVIVEPQDFLDLSMLFYCLEYSIAPRIVQPKEDKR